MRPWVWVTVIVLAAALPLSAQEGPKDPAGPGGKPPPPPPGMRDREGGPGRAMRRPEGPLQGMAELGLMPEMGGGLLTPEERGNLEGMSLEEKFEFFAGKRVQLLEKQKAQAEKELEDAKKTLETLKGLPKEKKMEYIFDRMAERLRDRLQQSGKGKEEVDRLVAERTETVKKLMSMSPEERKAYLADKMKQVREGVRGKLKESLVGAGLTEEEVKKVMGDGEGRENVVEVRDRLRDLLKEKGKTDEEIRAVLQKIRGSIGEGMMAPGAHRGARDRNRPRPEAVEP